MRNILHLIFGITLVFTAAGCSSPNDTNSGVKNRVKWGSVPSQYNPQMSDTTFNTAGVDTIRVNIQGFAADAEVVYADNVPAGQGILRTYKVSKNLSSAWQPIDSSLSDKILSLISIGNYTCSIHTENGQITDLDGGCYVRLQVLLPTASTIDVYNLNQLISTNHRLMSTGELITALHNTSWVGDKRVLLNDFLNSYQQAGKNPTFLAADVGSVAHEFDLIKDKLRILGLLQSFVIDRQNLGAMINREYPEQARDEARRIVGL